MKKMIFAVMAVTILMLVLSIGIFSAADSPHCTNPGCKECALHCDGYDYQTCSNCCNTISPNCNAQAIDGICCDGCGNLKP